MKECENCVYTDIADWEEDKETGKATPILWCERQEEYCDDICYCEFFDDGKGYLGKESNAN